MATIADVAKRAGLSRATVSRVLNNHPNVTEHKKRLVREAMESLKYVPNTTAQRLRNQRTDTIAIIVPVLTNPFFAYLLEAMDMVATTNHFQLLICQTRYSKQKELDFLELLRTKQVDGLILTSYENDWKQIEPYSAFGPMVLCNEYERNSNVPIIRMDQFEASYIGTRHLIEQGHERIACTCGDKSNLAKDRQAGYRKALVESGLLVHEEWIFSNVFDIEDGKRVFRTMMNLKDAPTAVFTGSDQVAAGMIMAAKAMGKNVPSDIAILGFDDQPIARVVEPALTTIKQPIEELGKTAMEVMIDYINLKKDVTHQEILLPYDLVIRDSTMSKLKSISI
ncbi:LacI family DNA-binding transcriptional regulator [Neobacillus cucumis]|uniref:LacI family DNA-binding transcriptional regulator n=1 Tax=Neobacillus cucumis TaxID=1740721 RepID=UPI0019627518|nr:LacI family DNA-binding transcriptional regulator [Neobacillus cucumis]MBM7650813.1 DNA-binding LacI/PurR family transcriptional regulator [Neobacillus cucumis]MED4227313.1 LacI family DNA-binding transcriptional regulator [Neobacillus cucumis]